MKTFKLTFIGLIFTLFALHSQKSQAQVDTRIGGLLAFGTEVSQPAIGVNGEFRVMDELAISPSFLYYFPKKEGPIKANYFEVNGNANYYFIEDENDFDVYGLAGLTYLNASVSYDGLGSEYFSGASSSSFGLNLGAGANMHLNGFMPFAELKYQIISGGQLVISAGVKFEI